MGVLYCDPAPSFDSLIMDQVAAARASNPKRDMNALLRGGFTWTVGEED